MGQFVKVEIETSDETIKNGGILWEICNYTRTHPSFYFVLFHLFITTSKLCLLINKISMSQRI